MTPWHMNKGRIWLPRSDAHGPGAVGLLDTFKAYATYSEVGLGPKMSLDDIVARIRRVPRGQWLTFVGLMGIALDGVGIDPTFKPNTQSAMVRTIMEGELQTKVLQALTEHGWVFAAPRPLLAIAKLTAAHAPEIAVDDVPANPAEFMAITYLALNDHLDDDLDTGLKTDPWPTILRFMVRNLPYANSSALETLVRIWTLFYLIPTEDVDLRRPEYPDFEQLFQQASGLTMTQFLGIAYGILILYVDLDLSSEESMRQWVFDPARFDTTAVARSDVERFLDRISLRNVDLQRLSRLDYGDADYFYNFSVLSERPLSRISTPEGPRYHPIYYPHFRWRVTEAVYWECFTGAESLGKVTDYFQAFGAYFQRYVERLFDRGIPHVTGLGQRMWKEPKYHEEDPAVDIIVRYPSSYVFVEVTGSQFQFRESQITGQEDAIAADLQKILYDEVEQLDKAIKFFFDRKLALDESFWNGEDVVYPLLVTYGSLPTFAPVWPVIEQSIADRSLLVHEKIRPLTAIDVAEVPMLIKLTLNGISIEEALKLKVEEYRDMSFRNFVIKRYPKLSNPSDVLEMEWKNFNTTIIETLFPGHAGGKEP